MKAHQQPSLNLLHHLSLHLLHTICRCANRTSCYDCSNRSACDSSNHSWSACCDGSTRSRCRTPLRLLQLLKRLVLLQQAAAPLKAPRSPRPEKFPVELQMPVLTVWQRISKCSSKRTAHSARTRSLTIAQLLQTPKKYRDRAARGVVKEQRMPGMYDNKVVD